MKRLLFSLIFLSSFVYAQKEIVFDKSINVENFKSLDLHFENIALDIRKSKDEKVHLDFKLELDNFSEKEKEAFINQIKFEQNIFNDKLSFSIKSKEEIAKRQMFSDERITGGDLSKLLHSTMKKYVKFNAKRKTKIEIIKGHNGFFKQYSEYYKLREKLAKSKKVKYLKSFFTIYIPENLLGNLNITAKECRFNFGELELKNLNLFTDGGYLNISKLTKSKITCWNGSVFLGEVDSSIIIGRSTTNILIGGIANSNLIAEYTKVEIGEVGEYNDIKDFNSRVYLYNFADRFKKFNFKGEYSEVYFFEPKLEYTMLCYGHDATYFFDTDTIVSQPSKAGKKSKMMEKRIKNIKESTGDIQFDIVHTKFHYPTSLNVKNK
ncbi:hypothetical protein ACSIGC_09880 [Tenacibaculum sp. ZS6-P6]|uniref:hypothetical protein n=1 Tax=Tenacibaculum sp. ZS6-P6 TaxID=3447503 RepID=UPI003F9D231B